MPVCGEVDRNSLVEWFRDAFKEHRAEVRKGFADTAAELGTLRTDVAAVQSDMTAVRQDIAEILRRVSNGRDRGD
jgi:hypothetical protein